MGWEVIRQLTIRPKDLVLPRLIIRLFFECLPWELLFWVATLCMVRRIPRLKKTKLWLSWPYIDSTKCGIMGFQKKTLVNVAVFYRILTVYLTPGHSKNRLLTPRLVQKLNICWYNVGTVDLPVFQGNWVGFMSMSVILCTMPMVSLTRIA